MGGIARFMGLVAIVPASVILTISFFVLLALRKIENQGLKVFGYVIAALLWISALLVFSSGFYVLSSGRCPMMQMMGHKMQGMMGNQGSMMPGHPKMKMMNNQMPAMTQDNLKAPEAKR